MGLWGMLLGNPIFAVAFVSPCQIDNPAWNRYTKTDRQARERPFPGSLADALGRARLWDVSDALSTFPPDGSGWPGGFTYGPGQFAYVYTDESGRQVHVAV